MKTGIGFMGSAPLNTLANIIRNLGLSTGLKLCLDAGDRSSYDGTSQTWVDTSGQGNSYFLGSNNTVQASDPVFHGSAGGLSSSEYFSFNGSNFFRESSDQSFADAWGNDGAIFSIMAIFYTGTTVVVNSIWTNDNSGKTVEFIHSGLKKPAVITNSTTLTSSSTLPGNAWGLLAASVSENAGASGSFVKANTSVTTGNMSTTPGAAPTAPYEIGLNMENAKRLMMLAAWDGVALSQANLASIYTDIKSLRVPTLP